MLGFTPMLRQFRIAAVAIALLAGAGCGIKGPLVLPPPAAPPTATPAPAGTSGANGDSPANPKPAAPERKP
jgi:predicted small lipoprotein YifL